MSFHTSRTLSHYGAFSAFSGAAPQIFVGGPDFVGGLDQGVFYGIDTSFTQGAKNQGFTWVPADQTLRKRAGDKWAELSEEDVSDKDRAWKEAMGRKLTTLLQSFFGALGSHSILGYSPDATQQIIFVGDQLKAELRKIVAYRVTHVTYEQPVDEPLPETTTARRPSSREAVQETRSGLTAGMPGGGLAPVEEEKPNILLYVGIGVGVLALGALLLRRRPAAATAGYRRRRRRR